MISSLKFPAAENGRVEDLGITNTLDAGGLAKVAQVYDGREKRCPPPNCEPGQPKNLVDAPPLSRLDSATDPMREELHLGPRQHLLLLALLALAAVVLIAMPDALLRLHYQCVLHALTGLRCPFCGMTRDFALMAHGQQPQNNPGSPLLAFALYVVYPAWLLTAALRRRAWPLLNREKAVRALVVGMAALFVGNNFLG
jgi:hypothetical protein